MKLNYNKEANSSDLEEKVVLDFDEVLFEMIKRFNEFHNGKYGTRLSFGDYNIYSLSKTLGVSEEEATKRVFLFYRSGFFRDLPIVDGSKEMVENLDEQEIFLIGATSRPLLVEEETMKSVYSNFGTRISETYLNPDFSKNRISLMDKASLCLRLGARWIVDDNLETVSDCAKRGVISFLPDKPWNQGVLPKKAYRVGNWENGDAGYDNILEHILNELK